MLERTLLARSTTKGQSPGEYWMLAITAIMESRKAYLVAKKVEIFKALFRSVKDYYKLTNKGTG